MSVSKMFVFIHNTIDICIQFLKKTLVWIHVTLWAHYTILCVQINSIIKINRKLNLNFKIVISKGLKTWEDFNIHAGIHTCTWNHCENSWNYSMFFRIWKFINISITQFLSRLYYWDVKLLLTCIYREICLFNLQ